MASAAVVKVACMVVLCMVVVAQQADAAVTCGLVTQKIAPCIGYLRGGALAPGCCPGIKALNAAAATPADRKIACNCLKSAAGAIGGINYGLAGGLPGRCGVNIPYKISPSTDCSKVN